MLAEAGCTFEEGTGHEKVYLGDRQSSLPRHRKDIGPYLFNRILRDLGLKGRKK
jgi:mRNA interferase HicA